MSEGFRTRFGRVENRKPKNTLVTFRQDGNIYFGIARCNSELDTFSRDLGKRIATSRAQLVAADTNLTVREGTNLALHESGLRGVVPITNVVQLIEYFRNIDSEFLPERLRVTTKAA